MNYAFRLGLVHFMRRDPNGIRRDPRWGVHGIVLLAWVLCIFVRDSTGSAVTRCRGSTQEDAQRASVIVKWPGKVRRTSNDTVFVIF